jgi:hypothetical protein
MKGLIRSDWTIADEILSFNDDNCLTSASGEESLTERFIGSKLHARSVQVLSKSTIVHDMAGKGQRMEPNEKLTVTGLQADQWCQSRKK